MAAADRIHIKGYELFLNQLYSDWADPKNWNDPKNAFTNQRNRTLSCSIVIQALAHDKRIADAKELFYECNRLHVWNSDTGIDFMMTDKKKISDICKRNLFETKLCLGLETKEDKKEEMTEPPVIDLEAPTLLDATPKK